MSSSIPLLIFAKAPRPGQVKTRLMPACSARQCADIASLLLEASVDNAVRNWPGRVVVACWPDCDHPLFERLQRQHDIELVAQPAGDLGVKMQTCLTAAGIPSAVIGSDAPHISARVLQQAHACLAEGQSVIGPSADGGYYLLGLAEAAPALFDGPEWGESSVLETTLSAASASGLKLQQLEPLRDIDRWEDVLAEAGSIPGLREYLLNEQLIHP